MRAPFKEASVHLSVPQGEVSLSCLENESLQRPGRGTLSQREGPLRRPPVTAASEKALPAIVLINTVLFPPWCLSPCLLCVNRVLQRRKCVSLMELTFSVCSLVAAPQDLQENEMMDLPRSRPHGRNQRNTGQCRSGLPACDCRCGLGGQVRGPMSPGSPAQLLERGWSWLVAKKQGVGVPISCYPDVDSVIALHHLPTPTRVLHPCLSPAPVKPHPL